MNTQTQNPNQIQALESSKANVLSAKRFKPEGFVLEQANEALGIEIWVGPTGLTVMGFKGRSIKSAFYIRFNSIESKTSYVTNFVDRIVKQAQENAEMKAARKAKARDLQVGDVLVSSWGYEQTNVDYFQVIELVGKASVKLQQIAKEKNYESRGDSGYCVPVLNTFCGEPFVKKVTDGTRVTLTSYSSATKKECISTNGVKVFKPDFWSSYA